MAQRRRSPRTVLRAIQCIHMEPNNHAIVLNISEQGLAFHAVYPVTEPSPLRICLEDLNGQKTEAAVHLVWMDATKKSGGLRFVSLPETARKTVQDWIARAARPATPDMASAPPQVALPPRPKKDSRLGATASAHTSTTSHRDGTPVRPPRPPQPRVASPPATPPQPAGEPDSAGPGFVLLESDIPGQPYMAAPEMFSPPRSKFFPGFLAGVVFSAILIAGMFFARGKQITNLMAKLRAISHTAPAIQVGSSAAAAASLQQQTSPPQSPASSAPVGASSSSTSPPLPLTTDQVPSIGHSVSGTGPAVSTAALSPASDSADINEAAHPPEQPSKMLNDAPSAYKTPPPDPGEADLAIAQQYLKKGNPVADRAAAGFLWAAVRKGSIAAELTLADLYARGDGVEKSCGQARVLLQAAAQNGNSQEFQDLAPGIQQSCR